MWMKEGQGQLGKNNRTLENIYIAFTLLSGEYQAFKLAQRSFYKEVCLIQSGFKEDQFLTVAKQTLEFQYNKRRKDEKEKL